MSNEKTLATAKHGGCVQLGNANIASGLRNMLSDIEQLGAAPMTVDTNLIRDAIAALSAQPSPVGQDGLNYERMFVDACAALAEVSRELGCDPEQGGAEPILAAIAELREALAARQPVGEPVGEVFWDNETGEISVNWIKGDLPPGIGTLLYEASPAQAVDLGQLPRAVELLSNVSRTLVDWAAEEQREAIGIVRALIDSHSAGGQQ